MFRISEALGCPSRWLAAVAASALIWLAPQTPAQDDLTAPPRIIDDTAAVPPPEPPEADAAGAMEEIVVISDQNPWRLPDLGSAWRAQQEEQQRETGRISVELVPLWDPEAEELPTRNPFAVTDGIRRVGFIEVFRVRFGGR